MPASKSGVTWQPQAWDTWGKITHVRIVTHEESVPVWQLVQVCLDAGEYRVDAA